jgi:hypothetical protein
MYYRHGHLVLYQLLVFFSLCSIISTASPLISLSSGSSLSLIALVMLLTQSASAARGAVRCLQIRVAVGCDGHGGPDPRLQVDVGLPLEAVLKNIG